VALLIYAGSMTQARIWADHHGLLLSEWHYLDDLSKIMALERGHATVVIRTGTWWLRKQAYEASEYIRSREFMDLPGESTVVNPIIEAIKQKRAPARARASRGAARGA
jgi:hypothetical protein